MIGAVAITLI